MSTTAPRTVSAVSISGLAQRPDQRKELDGDLEDAP
jgi:hypothetical protein